MRDLNHPRLRAAAASRCAAELRWRLEIITLHPPTSFFRREKTRFRAATSIFALIDSHSSWNHRVSRRIFGGLQRNSKDDDIPQTRRWERR